MLTHEAIPTRPLVHQPPDTKCPADVRCAQTKAAADESGAQGDQVQNSVDFLLGGGIYAARMTTSA